MENNSTTQLPCTYYLALCALFCFYLFNVQNDSIKRSHALSLAMSRVTDQELNSLIWIFRKESGIDEGSSATESHQGFGQRWHVNCPWEISQNQGSAFKGPATLFKKGTQFCNIQDWVVSFIQPGEQRY